MADADGRCSLCTGPGILEVPFSPVEMSGGSEPYATLTAGFPETVNSGNAITRKMIRGGNSAGGKLSPSDLRQHDQSL